LDRAAIDAGQHQVAPVTAQRVDIALSDGRRILVEGTTALAAVITMVEGLST
jgi:transposase